MASNLVPSRVLVPPWNLMSTDFTVYVSLGILFFPCPTHYALITVFEDFSSLQLGTLLHSSMCKSKGLWPAMSRL